MGRKCSHCGKFGHNSRTCTNFRGNTSSGFRLFGVQLHHDNFMMSTSSSTSHHINSLKVVAMSMKKSFSMDCLPTSSSSSSPSSSRISIDESVSVHDKASIGYLSDGLICRAQERKKGVPWTEEEHRKFLIGLEKLGKGDWRGISRNYVTSRTPTQVASHAQKYFLRQATLNKKKRRSSLFDMFGSNNDVDVPLSDALPPQHNNNSTRDISDHTTQLPVLELGTSSSQMSLKSSDIQKPDVPVWIFGLIDSQMKYSSSNAASKHDDDLELTLAVPMNSNLEPKNKSSSPKQQGGPLLNLGSISVT